MSLDEDTLATAARHGEIDYSKWPTIVEPLLHRLDHIVHNNFPHPRAYPILTPTISSSSETAQQSSGQPGITLVSQTPTTPRALPPVPPFPGSESSTSTVPNSQPEPLQPTQSAEEETNATQELPILLAQLLASITSTLRTSFSSKPPYTIQRLAELVLYPNNHYRTLPSYLRALDRVVSVSSSADIFPLADQPTLVNGVTNGEAGGILWKNDTNGHDRPKDNELGSDESLGGALLTPIPWLRDVHPSDDGNSDSNEVGTDTETDLLTPLSSNDDPPSTGQVDAETTKSPTDSNTSTPALTALASPHNDPLVPERADGAVTQGELIRMEQEAGVVPVTHSAQSSAIRTAGRSDPVPNSIALGVGIGLEDLPDDEGIGERGPHARGPDVVGTVDMGLVGGRDVEVHIGSPPDESRRDLITAVNVNDAQGVLEGSEANQEAHRRKDSDSEDSYVDIGKEITGGDEMQIDSDVVQPATSSDKDKKGSDEDEDIVFVDADGATKSERKQIDEVGGQEGNDAGDTTR